MSLFQDPEQFHSQGQDNRESLDGGDSASRVRGRYRLYGKTRFYTIALLWKMQGKNCFYHFEDCTNRPEAIAHIDHDRNNWNPENLAASCKHCNGHISNLARGKTKDRSAEESMRVCADASLPGFRWAGGEQLPVDPVSINRVKEPMFVKFSKTFLNEHGRFEKGVFIRRAALACGVSIDTVRDRYLPKHSVYPGFLTLVRDDTLGQEFVELRYGGDGDGGDSCPKCGGLSYDEQAEGRKCHWCGFVRTGESSLKVSQPAISEGKPE